MSAKRTQQGGRIDRKKALNFTWDGKPMSGYAGDSLASALMANNQTVLGRSFKYHRPRGIMSCGVEESGAIVTVGEGARRDANVKATMQELYEGLAAYGQNAWPNVRYDVGAVNNLFGRFLSAGFYYKTFMGTKRLPYLALPFLKGGTEFWMLAEKIIRKAAGMGTASREPDPDCYDHAHGFCDVLVVGSGPAGLSAALVAAKAGLDVLLVEQDNMLGGDLLNQPVNQPAKQPENNPENQAENNQGNSAPAQEAALGDAEQQRLKLIKQVEAAGARIMLRTTAFGLYDYSTAGLLQRITDHMSSPNAHTPRQCFWTIRAKHTIVATGAMERGFAFGNNDRPAVMTVNAARAYLNRYGVLAGERIVVATNNDSAYVTATELAAAGGSVSLIDARTTIRESAMAMLGENGISLQTRSAPLNAKGSRLQGGASITEWIKWQMKSGGLKGVDFAVKSDNDWVAQGSDLCDLLVVSGGWSPVVHLMSHRGIKPLWNEEQACFIAPQSHEPISMAGSMLGVWNTADCLTSGQSAGARAAKALGCSIRQKAAPAAGGWDSPIEPLYSVSVAGKNAKSFAKSFVDPQHDVTTDDITLAHREGFVSVEHLKRYTTLGMATDGGKVGNIIGLALMADAQGKEIPQVGTTTFRPPYTPVSIGALKGRNVDEHFRALRRTPMHDWNIKHGATMTMAGLWQRPWYFARAGEDIKQAYIRETETTRKTVGLCDVTSLGKIAIQGADSTDFLNRIYTNPFAKLTVGKARYGIMLRDDGIVMDDGTTWRLSDSEYFMTTTTAHAARVMAWLEELLQTRWQDLKVHVTSVSEQWAGCAVAGPNSRDVLSACVQDSSLVAAQALPFMGVIETVLQGGIPCRIARISFSGEMAYEVYVPSDYAHSLMDLLMAAAEPLKGCLYGTEALGAMRIEKGHVTGAELDGRVSIEDAGLGKMASPNKSFIGSALRQRPELLREDRPRLVGIKPKDKTHTFNAGAILCAPDKVAGMGCGWITAVTHSPALGHWIGLGFIAGGFAAWEGKTVIAADPVRSGNVEVEVISPHMYDPSGERMHG